MKASNTNIRVRLPGITERATPTHDNPNLMQPRNPLHRMLACLATPLAVLGLGLLQLVPSAQAVAPVMDGLTVWLDAAQLSASDGATVDTWKDMSGLGNHAMKSGGAPKYKADALNGQPVIRFDGASSFTTADLSSQFPTAATVFIVATLNAADYTLVHTNSAGDEYFGWHGTTHPAVFRNPRIETYCHVPTSGSHLFAISSSATAWQMWIDGANQGVAGGAYHAGGVHVIGAGGYAGFLTGDIPEFILYNRVLTTNEANQVGAYLAAKYGLTTAYGGVVPYSDWASNNAPGQTPSEDHDNDGVQNGIEYFMGANGSTFTALPGLDAGNTLIWPMNTTFSGTYQVQTSPDLGTWTDVTDDPGYVTRNTDSIMCHLPPGAGKLFVRLVVMPN